MRKLLYFIFDVMIGMIAYTITNGSWFWTILDFLFAPIAIVKWLICHDLTLTVIKNTFGWFFN